MKTKKLFKAKIYINGKTYDTTANRENGIWMIGGDYARGVFKSGGKISIYNNGKIYSLRGNRLVFQDFYNHKGND